jgi:hypothetical protein
MIALMLTDMDLNEIRKALSVAEQSHRKHGFKALENLVADLRSKLNDAMLDAMDMIV